MAELMYSIGQEHTENMEKDACGPDCPTALDLFNGLKKSIGSRGLITAPGFLTTK